MFTHVSVWLDNHDDETDRFRQGLAWAAMLDLPLEGCTVGGKRTAAPDRADEAFAQASASRKVAWNQVHLNGDLFEGMRYFLRPRGLSVCGDGDLRRWGRKLPPGMLDALQTGVVFVPHADHGLKRLLVLDHEAELRTGYLDALAQLCMRLGIEPVVLTVTDDERIAAGRRGALAPLFHKHHVRADYDVIRGADLVEAVHLVAACRECSHVVVENTPPGLRNRWWRRDPVDMLRKQSGELGIVVYPRPPEDSARFVWPPQQAKPDIDAKTLAEQRGAS
jgi:hypothetical protein